MVEVTQADRALAELTRRGKGGKYDRDVGELAFLIARHREAALTTAQAEADALRAEVERLSYDGIHTCHDSCPRLPCVQRREIERLREALLDALDAPMIDHSGRKQGVYDIIRAALSEPTT